MTQPEPDLSFRARIGQAVACDESICFTRPATAVTMTKEMIALSFTRGYTMFFADFDWGQVGRSALIGGAIGAVVGLVAWLARRNKSKDDDDKRA